MKQTLVWLAHNTVVVAALATSGLAQTKVASEVRTSAPASDGQAIMASPVTVSLEKVSLRQAVRAVVASARVRVLYVRDVRNWDRVTVSLHASKMPLSEALAIVLRGTTLQAMPLQGDLITITAEGAQMAAAVAGGTILGTVIDAKTGRPIRDATIGVDGITRGVETSEDGIFRLAGIVTGSHTIMARRVGYVKQSRSVMVDDGTATTVNFILEPSANVLDQVVVTGTVIQTELKAVPNAITVITAQQIEERGITKIDQLFRGDIPGLFALNQGSNALLDEVTMFSRGATALSTSSSGVSIFFTNPIKTYIDGVELADPKYLSQIDPKSIERIEILTGPQASTIYGSNAINGVMQIFTKRGSTSHPQLSLNLLSGWVENNFSSSRTPQHDYSAQLNGIEGKLSYNTGGSWNYMGPWTPAKQLARTGGFGGVRLDLPTTVGRVTADMTLRRSITQSRQHGDAVQTWTDYREAGWYSQTIGITGLSVPQTRALIGQTLGLVLSYAPTSWWSHELGLGQDAVDSETRYTARGYTNISDTTLLLQQSRTDRHSLRYATTARVPIGTSFASLAQATITAGADAWQNLSSSWSVQPQTLTGPLTGSASVRRQPGHNAGGFLQSQFGIKNRLFLTYGLRAEWNPGFGKEAQPNYAPRYGIAYSQELGAVTAKLRGSYGRSTRPPQPKIKAAQTFADFRTSLGLSVPSSISQFYAPFDAYLANPDLAPEHQRGGEGGLELYFGTRGSLVVTRYNQTVDGLIAFPKVDSVRSLTACAISFACSFNSSDVDGYGYWYQLQYLNIGTIRNQGWELQGSLHVGPLTTSGTYSWTKSQTIGVNPKYRSYFTPTFYPQYQPGATFQYLPEHTWAFGVIYSKVSSSVGLNLTGTGRATINTDDFSLRNLSGSIRLPQNQLSVSSAGRYINFNSPYALADLTASHRFCPQIEGVLQVQNLTDRYTNDYFAGYASLGRQVKIGARLR